MNSETFIQIDHVTFGYDANRPILNDVSMQFARGKVTAILGGSGCGKTTLLRLIGGVYRPQQGRVVFDGEEVDTRNRVLLQLARRPPHRVDVLPDHLRDHRPARGILVDRAQDIFLRP